MEYYHHRLHDIWWEVNLGHLCRWK